MSIESGSQNTQNNIDNQSINVPASDQGLNSDDNVAFAQVTSTPLVTDTITAETTSTTVNGVTFTGDDISTVDNITFLDEDDTDKLILKSSTGVKIGVMNDRMRFTVENDEARRFEYYWGASAERLRIEKSGNDVKISNPSGALLIENTDINDTKITEITKLEFKNQVETQKIRWKGALGDDFRTGVRTGNIMSYRVPTTRNYEWRFDSTNFMELDETNGLKIDNVTQLGSSGIKFNNDVGIGIAPTEQLQITNNFRLPKTTLTVGQIKSDGNVIIHNFGTNNFFAGTSTGNLTLSGCEMCAVGPFALTAITSGDSNAAFGVTALQNCTTGGSNTACGHNALRAVIDGFTNTGCGGGAGDNITSGDRNTAVGASSMGTTTGNQNTTVGAFSMGTNTTGIQNTALGDSAGPTSSGLTNSTALGFFAQVNASNKVRVGSTAVTVIEGQVDWTFSSDANLKENFVTIDDEEMLEKLSELPVTSWNYIGHDKNMFRHYGPTAQDWYKLFGTDAIGHFNGGINTTINSGDISGVLLVAVKSLYEYNKMLEKRLKIQNIKINRLFEKLQ